MFNHFVARRIPLAVFLLSLTMLAGLAQAEALDEVKQKGLLRVAVYEENQPFSDDGKGIEIELGKALAAKLGVKADVFSFDAAEDMSDDFRNMIWKGHYLNPRMADVMLHVPVDKILMEKNDKVHIFAPYYNQQISIIRNLVKIPVFVGLEAFTRVKIGVQGDTISDAFMVGTLGGRFRDSVTHYKTIKQACEDLKAEKIEVIMGHRAEIEAAFDGSIPSKFALTSFTEGGLSVKDWNLGLAVKADSPQLGKALEDAMKALRDDGTVQKIFEKYGVSYQQPMYKAQR
jgi:polar amino acid transport system substrate-binding protein